MISWGCLGEQGVIDNAYEGSFGNRGNILKLDCYNGCITINLLKINELHI